MERGKEEKELERKEIKEEEVMGKDELKAMGRREMYRKSNKKKEEEEEEEGRVVR